MQFLLYRHAEPVVSAEEIISGRDFPLWVQRYNESDILPIAKACPEEKIVYTSNLLRSIETGYAFGKKINVTSLLREAEIPLIQFPSKNLKARAWLFIARVLWMAGVSKDCESFEEAKSRARQVVHMFKALVPNEQRIVAVGHGFMNRLIKKELIRRGWTLKQSSRNHSFLSRMIFEVHY